LVVYLGELGEGDVLHGVDLQDEGFVDIGVIGLGVL
jgi:hypothetical protein